MKKCEWSYEDWFQFFSTSCGEQMIYDEEAMNNEPEFKFCPYCGKAIEWEGQPDD